MNFILRLIALALVVPLHANAQNPEPKKSSAPANSELDGQLLYQLLLGELNTQIGEPAAGYSLLLDAARKTNDARLYKRAVDIALQARSGDSALQAARAWRQSMPTSKEANRYLLQILIGLNRISELVDPIKRDIALSDPKERATAIISLPRYFARSSDKKQAVTIVEQSLVDYLTQPGTGVAAWSTIGRMRLEALDAAGALDAARRAQTLGPVSEEPALLALQLMNIKQEGAEGIVRKYLDGKPMPEVRMEYARVLLGAQRYAEASRQIRRITSEKPDFAEAWLIQGALELQDNQLDLAEKSLKRYLEVVAERPQNLDKAERDRGLTQAYLSLSQVYELRKNFPEAENWLRKITSPENLVRAQNRRASLLARQGKLDEAIQLIRSLPQTTPTEARLKLGAEIQLLRDSKKYKEAYDLLAAATTKDPSDFDFLYDQATLAEKLGNPDLMEQLLRRIIAGKPDYHHAYNALGYSFADRNVRLTEARQLIVKALEFAPDDPYITDSLAWVEFRMGNKAEALRLLQTAYKAKPDAEIAAHLGEVLLSMGRRTEALSIWKEGLLLNAENETLLETLKRLQIQP